MPDIRPKLTPRQDAILNFIAAEIGRKGRPPSIREIGEQFAIGSPNGVMGHLKALEQKGFIRMHKLQSRGIEIIGRNDALLSVLNRSLSAAQQLGQFDLVTDIRTQITNLKKAHA